MNEKGTLLIVDDTPASLKLLADTLEAEGYTVRAAADGELALRSCLLVPPELILLDVRMPGIDGFETCRRLKAEASTRAVPVMFLSASTELDEKVQGFALGAVDFVGKPFQRNELLARVHTHLSLYRLSTRLEALVAARTAALAESEARLRQLNEHLELRVRERTAELEQAMAQIIETRKLASIATIMAGMSHELSTPIGNIITGASSLDPLLAEMAAKLSESKLTRASLLRAVADIEGAFELVLRNARRAATLIERFKLLAGDHALRERSQFDLHDAVHDIARAFQPMLQGAHATIRLDVARGITLDSYPGALEKILVNLLSNSLTHGFAGREGGHITLHGQARDGRLTLDYADNGCGMDPALLARVFDPFHKAQLGQGGPGLGLAIVHNLTVAVFKGTVDLDSVAGAGVRLRFSWPLVTPGA